MAVASRSSNSTKPPPIPTLSPEGDCAVRVQFGERIEPAINQRVHVFCRAVAGALIPGVLECAPAYCVATVYYQPKTIGYEALQERLLSLSKEADAMPTPAPLIEIPVAYGAEYGPDLPEVATHLGLPEDEIVERHSNRPYLCYMIGFMPGFPYLGELPGDLRLPRRETPRVRVPAGSVAIADAQTGIYPQESPGGWHLIGRTPIPLFDPAADPPTTIQPGDNVRFVPIDPSEFAAIEDKIKHGKYIAKRIIPDG